MKIVTFLPLAASVVLLASGCVSTKDFETAVSDVTTRIDNVQGQVEKHGERLDELAQRDDQLAGEVTRVEGQVTEAKQAASAAMSEAQVAKNIARGKVLWQVTLTNDQVRFGVDKAELNESGTAALDDLVAKVKNFDRTVYLEIQGHTDSTGNEAYNEKLGLRRAEMVRDYLYGKELPLHMLQVVSYGEKKPIADNSTADGRAANRRVEILVLE